MSERLPVDPGDEIVSSRGLVHRFKTEDADLHGALVCRAFCGCKLDLHGIVVARRCDRCDRAWAAAEARPGREER